jgi:hypothetical protein
MVKSLLKHRVIIKRPTEEGRLEPVASEVRCLIQPIRGDRTRTDGLADITLFSHNIFFRFGVDVRVGDRLVDMDGQRVFVVHSVLEEAGMGHHLKVEAMDVEYAKG